MMRKKFISISNVDVCDLITFDSLNNNTTNDPKEQKSNDSSENDEQIETRGKLIEKNILKISMELLLMIMKKCLQNKMVFVKSAKKYVSLVKV